MLILLIASIPVAMPAVFSITMALGAFDLSRQKAIVSRLEAIEEMAGVDILCTDKTGTLTKNQLKLGDAILIDANYQLIPGTSILKFNSLNAFYKKFLQMSPFGTNNKITNSIPPKS